ncbi:diaminopimelate epimerase [Helicobacter himalayensis]|uniref:diaminopimelate epimerase n=1 Tax=Helicobacter himalayensis TaxID=1591088 RepID=UPI003D6E40D5
MDIEVTKYCANGNDFLLYNAFTHTGDFVSVASKDFSAKSGELNFSQIAKILCARHSGLGADGFVAVLPINSGDLKDFASKALLDSKKPAYKWDFYNADGSKAAMCGNASRCVGSFAYTQGIAELTHSFLSQAGIVGVSIDSTNPLLVESVLGKCKFLREVQEESIWGERWFLLDSGVPHLVCFCENPALLPLPAGENLTRLKQLREKYNANINVACVQEKGKIAYATFERGVEDVTLACGSGAVAILAQSYKLGLSENSALLIPPSKESLEVRVDFELYGYLKGKVSRISECKVDSALFI